MKKTIDKFFREMARSKVPVVIINLCGWAFFAAAFQFVLLEPNQSGDYLKLIKTIVLLSAVFYLNYFFLIPRYLSKRKFKLYATFVFCLLTLVFVIDHLFFLFFEAGKVNMLGDNELTGNWIPITERPLIAYLGIVFLSLISITVSTSIRVTQEWFKNENSLKEIENKKLLAELSYLKAQINPHFFFNTLNGIYALARQKSDKTPEVIMMLSTMMRYIIYEASSPKVPLKKELKHIENLIDLQKLRLTEMVKVDFRIEGNPKDILIEPLLFSVLVENAFKHGIDYSKKNTIKVHLKITEGELNLLVSNPIVQVKKKKDSEPEAKSGIGLENIQKRLELLYPENHVLVITEKNSVYTVELKLNLENLQHEVPYH